MIASALLPVRLTFVVGFADLGAVASVYGAGIQEVAARDRFITVPAVFLAFVISLVVCRLREEQHKRLRKLTISRARLRLLSEAGRRVGSTLDVSRTAAELADVAVPEFADLSRVDLLVGREPCAAPTNGTERVYLAARQGGPSVVHETPRGPGNPMTYRESSGPAFIRMTVTG
ncbi:hypothetical protein ACIO1C_00770 [Streptomyces sp. NPDC087420]|uniref:hypothetical protein n=1 Tax=Streptomyces sp. NPDC087420 TaxID=3365785 RepID=UPI0038385071